MNRFYAFGASALIALSVLSSAPAQGVSQAFTYQGFLRQSGAPLTNPSQQMTFRIYDALTGGSLLWNSGALTVNVNNGLFTVQLNAPASVWNGAERFLEIQVGATTLSPRVRLNPTPYANTSTQVNLFQNGMENPDRMVITHSPAFSDWGLQYRDIDDSFHFLAAGFSRMSISLSSGSVGIGTTNPVSRLTVASEDTVPLTLVGNNTHAYLNVYTPLNTREVGVLFSNPNFAAGGIVYNNFATPNGLQFRTNGNVNRAVITDTGRMGIGTVSPAAQLHVQGVSGNRTTAIITSDAGAYRNPADWFSGWGGGLVTWDILCQGIRATNVIVDSLVRTAVLEITGADLAEKFPTTDTVEAGMVVEIDPDNPGHLRKAQGAYNTRVAGVVAGANGLPTGIVLGNLQGSEQHTAIAMSGRVWVYADATECAIEPGTLLTTADKPGYAMAVRDRDRAQGAILGKAMTRLEKGKTGMVLVLVNLQ